MTIQEFIEKAVQGLWDLPGVNQLTLTQYGGATVYFKNGSSRSFGTADILLMPQCWQAVARVEAWDHGTWSREVWTNKDDQLHAEGLDRFGTTENGLPAWRWYMHRMIDALAEGRSIEDFLAEL